MPFLVPLAGCIVRRGALKITPPAGVPFEFTDEEAAKFLASPTQIVRELIVETAPAPSAPAPQATTDGKKHRKGAKAAADDDL